MRKTEGHSWVKILDFGKTDRKRDRGTEKQREHKETETECNRETEINNEDS
jgi:hypothetical protein